MVNVRKLIPVLFTINLAVYSGLSYVALYTSNPVIKSIKPIITKANSINQVTTKSTETEVIIDTPKSNHFPYGQCTWYVATKRNIPWNGNAIDWYKNAQKYGRKVGRQPKEGAILVTRESRVGHVAYVEKVIGDNFTVSEMNNPTWGKVTKRNLTIKEIPFVGFIY